MSKALCAALLCTPFLCVSAQTPKPLSPKALAPKPLPARVQAAKPEPATPAAQLTIHTDRPLHAVSPILYGMMTEEINHAFDGGLYPELINNRSFRWAWRGAEHWNLALNGNAAATLTQDKSTGPSKALPASAELTVTNASIGNEAGLSNTGYWGIAVHPRTTYKGSFYAKANADLGPINASLISDTTGATLASAEIPLHAGDWQQYTFTLTTKIVAPSTANHLALTVTHPGHLWLQLVSLMPPTFNDRPNGFRPDLMQKMAGLHPHFLRLPGGNYLEGDNLADWYNWKETVGPLVDRPGHQAPWSYWSSDGLGLLDFLNWCEDLKIEPVLAVYAGYSLKQVHVTPGKDLEPYVQSALDEVEYVTGDTSTKWGARRAADGHPAPFPLHYIEIGNEDEFDKSKSYDARFAQFAIALRKKYPQYKLIATTPVKVSSAAEPDVIDDHYYKTPSGMMALDSRYDNAPRNGPKIFVGEWATQSGDPTPDFGAALADAAFMTGLERNSDLIVMASYAPLFTNINPGAIQWHPDLIGYDGLKSYASPSYYAQSLFAGHLGDTVPATTITGANSRFFQSSTIDTKAHKLYLKLVNASTNPQPITITIDGLTQSVTASVNTLHAATYNSLTHVPAGSWNYTVPALTIQVIDIPLH
ncbi:MAG: alpha-L-arabinofuranosidase C-terminal domain-containing protein [Acidobacteriota bacterium]